MLKDDIEEVLVSQTEIVEICEKLGKEIEEEYKNKNVIILGLLRGCVPFMAELLKHINCYLEIDFMDVSSYHGGIQSTGDILIEKDISISVKDRHVLIAEDIVDTGMTLKTVVSMLKFRGAASVEVVTLLDKPEGRTVDFIPKYIGKNIPNKFVVGFGLDYNNYYRNLPYVGILKPKVYSK